MGSRQAKRVRESAQAEGAVWDRKQDGIESEWKREDTGRAVRARRWKEVSRQGGMPGAEAGGQGVDE